MRKLILYYSRSGHNKKIAQELAKMIEADIEEIIDLDPRGFIISGWQAIQKRKTKIAPLESKLEEYDQVILSTPFWVGGLPPATRTFLENNPELKNFAILSISGSGIKNEGFVDVFEKQYNVKASPRLLISDTDFAKQNYQDQLKNFTEKINKETK